MHLTKLTVTILMVSLFFGCGGGSDSSNPADQSTQTITEPSTSDTDGTSSDETDPEVTTNDSTETSTDSDDETTDTDDTNTTETTVVEDSNTTDDETTTAETNTSEETTTPDDLPPVLTAIDDQYANEDAAAFDITLDATDPDDDAVTYSAISSDTSKATVSVSENILTIIPIANANGTVTITTTATANGLSDSKSFTLTLNSINDNPTANDIAVTIDLDSPKVSLDWYELSNISDIDNDTLTASILTDGTYGTMTVSGHSLIYNITTATSATDNMAIRVSDGNGGTVDISVSISITKWSKVSAGYEYTLAIKDDGTLWDLKLVPDNIMHWLSRQTVAYGHGGSMFTGVLETAVHWLSMLRYKSGRIPIGTV